MPDLRDLEPPDAEHAERRAWAVTSEAFAERKSQAEIRSLRKVPGRLRRVVEGSAVAVIVASAAFLTLTEPGAAVGDWVARVVEPAPEPAKPKPRAELDGKVLTVGERLRWNGRALGRWSGAAFSPRAKYAVAWRGRRLAALDRSGDAAWVIGAPALIRSATWSPEGFHVAYLVNGRHPAERSPAGGARLRVVAGNGLRDRAFRGPVHDVAPVFRPGERRSLTWVRMDGRVDVVDVFSGARRARSGPRLGAGSRQLAWTSTGRRLALLAYGGVRVWDPARGTVATYPLAGQAVDIAAAGRVAALTYDARRDVSTIRVLGRGALTSVRGRLTGLRFSPDGTRLLASLPRERRRVVVRVSTKALEEVPRATGRVVGWAR